MTALAFLALALGGDEPAIEVLQKDYTIVRITSESVPGLVFDVWCYEDRLGKAVESRRDGKATVLVHKAKGATVTSRFTPEPGSVAIEVTVEGPDAASVQSLNPCCQLRASPRFGNEGDYVEDFVARCFVFLERGLTLLKDTKRIPGTRDRKNDKANAPNPWIQEYVPAWRRHPGQVKGQRGFSTDRPVAPIIGTVSRDGNHLVAVAWPETGRLGQVWHSCIHPRPAVGESFDGTRTRSRARIYLMKNDGAALLARFRKDFPGWTRPPDRE